MMGAFVRAASLCVTTALCDPWYHLRILLLKPSEAESGWLMSRAPFFTDLFLRSRGNANLPVEYSESCVHGFLLLDYEESVLVRRL